MARFTGGVASYQRRVTTGNYEHKEFKAEISWSSDEGDTGYTVAEMVDLAASTAVKVVHERLGIEKKPRAQIDAVTVAAPCLAGYVFPADTTPTIDALSNTGGTFSQATATVFQNQDTAVRIADHLADPALTLPDVETVPREDVDPPKVVDVKRHRATKAEMEARAAAKAEGDAAKARLMVTEDPLSGVPATSGTDAADLSEPLGGDPLAEPAEIGNDDLLKACEKVVAKKQDQLAVRRLIGQYAKQLSMIPQSRRQAFLNELAAI